MGTDHRPLTTDHLTDSDLLRLYYFLKLNRSLEDRLVALYRQGKITATVFTSRGQEATSVGSAYAMAPQDVVCPLTRNIGTMLVRGVRPRDIFTQYIGTAAGPTKGKERIHYFGDLQKGMVASLSVLGDMIPVMAGVALASRITGSNAVAMTYLGDGATSTGNFHEGMNFASVLKLPLVLIIENNLYAYSTPVSKQYAHADFAMRAKGFGIPADIVDGNDVLEVYRVTRAAVERARNGGGASIIEAKTMRMGGHSDADPAWYVPSEIMDEWKKRDPILQFDRQLREIGLLNDAELGDIEERIRKEIEQDLEFALSSPMPEPGSALDGIYAG